MRTSDETLTEISNEIIGDVPENLSPYDLSRYIYIKLGQSFSYDEEYYIEHDEQGKNAILNKSIDDIWKEYKIEKGKDPNANPKAICTQFAQLYAELLEKYESDATQSFKASYERKNGDYGPHAFVDVTIDNKKYRTDLTRDLQHIKAGLSIDNFMKEPIESEKYGNQYANIENQNETFSEIDSKAGYIEAKEITDKIKNGLKEKTQKEMSSPDTDIKKVLEEQIKYLQENIPAYVTHSRDKANYFLELLKSSATREEGARFNVSNSLACIDNTLPSGKGKNVRNYVSFEDKESGDKIILTFTDDEYAKEVNQEDLKEAIRSGQIKTISSEKEKQNLLNKMAGLSEIDILKDTTISETITKHATHEKNIIAEGENALNKDENSINKNPENINEKDPSNEHERE